MAWHQPGAKPLYEPVLEYCWLDPKPGTNFSEILINQNSYIFIQENAFENVICKVASILSWPNVLAMMLTCNNM